MKKYAIAFYFLAIILIVLSILTLISSVQLVLGMAQNNMAASGDFSFYNVARSLLISLQQVIYPIVVGIICLFLARLIKMFDDPEISKKTIDFIHSLRSAGEKND